VEGDLVVLDAHAQPSRDAVKRPLKPGIIEGNQPPALIADEMMVVLATRQDPLIPGEVTSDAHALGETVLDQ
jgi:hypothetical protein